VMCYSTVPAVLSYSTFGKSSLSENGQVGSRAGLPRLIISS
jgi:hypothetical protein